MQRRAPIYDKGQDGHYNLISALHKSVRGSDPDAALYYLARMLDAGEDPLYLGRRLVRMAVGGYRPCRSAGAGDRHRRQGRLRLSRLARRANWRSPRRRSISPRRRNRTPSTPPSRPRRGPPRRAARCCRRRHILNAPTKLMKDEGYGAGYRYDHDAAGRLFRPGLFPRGARPPDLLRPARPRLRARDQEAAGLLGEAQAGEGRGVEWR